MSQKIRTFVSKIIAVSFVFMNFVMLALALPTNQALAISGPQPWATEGVCAYSNGANTVATIQGLQCLLANVLSVAVTFIGIIAFFIFMISAIKIMVSGGNSKGIEEAKGSMTYAVVGIVVALSAFLILNFISSFTGIDFTKFIIPDPSKEWETAAPVVPQQQPQQQPGRSESPFRP